MGNADVCYALPGECLDRMIRAHSMHHTSLQNEELARAARREMEPPPGERPRVSGGGVWARGLVRPTLVGHLPGVKGWRRMMCHHHTCVKRVEKDAVPLPHMASPLPCNTPHIIHMRKRV